MIEKDNIVSVTKHYDPIDSNFWNYKVVYNTDQICFVPNATDNLDKQAIDAWIAAGNSVVDPNE